MNAEGIFPSSAAKLIIQVKFNLEMEVEGGDGTGFLLICSQVEISQIRNNHQLKTIYSGKVIQT